MSTLFSLAVLRRYQALETYVVAEREMLDILKARINDCNRSNSWEISVSKPLLFVAADN